MAANETTQPRALLMAANDGREVICRESDGLVFIRTDVAAEVIERLHAALTEIKKMRPQPIPGTGFQARPASLLMACQRIATQALKVKR